MSSRKILSLSFYCLVLWLSGCVKPEVKETPTAVPPSPTVIFTPAPLPWSPQVVYTSPAPGEELPVDGAVTIRFDQPMDRLSVESAFLFAQTDSDDEYLEGTFAWPRPDTVMFTPADLNRQHTYRVQLGPQALGENKLPLRESFSLDVRPVGFLAVLQVIPVDDSEVGVDTAVSVIFNRAVVPLTPTDQQAELPQPLLFDPPVQGHGEWLSTTIYRFSPDEPLPGGTTYQVEIPAGFADLTDSPMAEAYSWTFRTQAPAITDISLMEGIPDLAPNGTITMTFNTPMDTASTEAAISIGPASPGGLSFVWDDNHRVLAVTPQRPLALETLYTLIVAPSAQSANGQASLATEYQHNFRSYPYPKVVSTEPLDGELVTEEDLFYSLPDITFAGPMDPDSFVDRIIVQPPPNDLNYTYREYMGSSNEEVIAYLSVHFTQVPSTQYTVTVLGDVADPYGNTLGEDYTFEYSTPAHSPLLHLNLPGNQNVGHLSRSFPSAVDLIYRNISQAEVALYDAGLPFGLLFDPYENLPVYTPDVEPLRSWTFANTAVPNEVTIQNVLLADGGVLPNGVYFVAASSPEIVEPVRWQDDRAVLIVADTNLMIKQTFDTVYVWATDLAAGSPAVGRTVTLYDETGEPQGTAVTDADGFASFPFISPEDDLLEVLVVSNASGQPGFGIGYTEWSQSVGGINFWQQERPYRAYIYTDRPIYRPGDTVYFRGIVRDTNYGRYNPASLTTLPMIVEPWSTNQDATIYFQENITLDKNGTFIGQFMLPDDTPLGEYFLNIEDFDISVQFNGNGVFFEVAEYRKPEFQVTVTPEKPQALIGEEITATVTATYYFGGPAANLPVQWATCYGTGYTAQNYCGQPEPTGEGLTDSQGQLTIPVPTVLLPDAPNDQWITVMAVVSGVGELPTAGFSTIRLYTAETLARIKPTSYVNRANQEMRLDVTTIDWEDNAAPNTPVAVTFARREWTSETTGIYHYTTWEPVDTPITTITVTTNELGYAPVLFVPPAGGSYAVTAVATDTHGRSYTTTTTFYASDPFTVWGGANSRGLTLVADQDSYAPGDTARILVQSPFTDTVSAWMTIERGVTVEQQLITLNGSSQILEIPVTADYAPNVYVTVIAVRGTDAGRQFADAQIGVVNLPVSTEQLDLTISLTPQDTQLAPGDTVTYDIAVTDYLGQPVQANLSLALVDLAVLSLKPDNSPPILDVFYANQSYRSQMGGGLFISAEGLPINIPSYGFGGGGGDGGGFGLSGEDSYGLEEGARRDFPDTAYWEGNITTDENGRVSVAIPLPDSTTTWRLSSKAVSLEGTLVGQTSTDVVVTKPLLIQPMTPRFFTVGDQVVLGAAVHNNTAETLNGTARLEASGVSLLTEAEQAISIAPGDSEIVQWPVRVEDVAFVDLTFLATAGAYSDATKPTFGIAPDQLIPVIHYEALDVVGSSGVLAEPGNAVEAIFLPETVTDGEVILQLTPSLAAALLDALAYTSSVDGRSACAHELGNRLLANVTVLRALEQLEMEDDTLSAQLDDSITADLNRLLALMKGDGGWGWCGSADSDPVLTASIALAVLQAQALGYTTFSCVGGSSSTSLGIHHFQRGRH